MFSKDDLPFTKIVNTPRGKALRVGFEIIEFSVSPDVNGDEVVEAIARALWLGRPDEGVEVTDPKLQGLGLGVAARCGKNGSGKIADSVSA